MTEKTYTPEEAEIRRISELPDWRVEGDELCRDFKTAHWKASMLVANLVGYLAEAAWHHPDMIVSWGKVQVRLTTHSAGGLTPKDFELATEIERAVGWRPGEDSNLEGIPDDSQWQILADD
ncbi:MAG: 4a-hydroxytetrahydrobiopterin dehydratase [Gammaproteobacteria bacterium]